ncbi:hypothetical protein Tco_0724432 [Tanacetum coccineum]
MKVEESLNVTFDESPPPTKLSPLVDDDVGEEEAIRNNTKIVNTNNEKNESIEVEEIVNIKESKNHPLDQIESKEKIKALSMCQRYNKIVEIDDASHKVSRDHINKICIRPRFSSVTHIATLAVALAPSLLLQYLPCTYSLA